MTNVMLVAWGLSPALIVSLFAIEVNGNRCLTNFYFIFKLLVCENFFNFEKFENIKKSAAKSWTITSYLFHRYAIGLFLMHVVVFSAKLFTGAHRPHFFETCIPDRMLNCTLGTFVNDFVCTNTKEKRFEILDASQSFFSGHAATCVFSCLFICWYLQLRIKNQALFMLPFVQTVLICLSFYGSISRVFDHRHHWWDVMTGAFVGVLTVLYTVKIFIKF